MSEFHNLDIHMYSLTELLDLFGLHSKTYLDFNSFRNSDVPASKTTILAA